MKKSLLSLFATLAVLPAVIFGNKVTSFKANAENPFYDEVSVHFPNVYTHIPGRNDMICLCVLIQYKNINIIVDAATSDDGCTQYVENYLKKQNVNKVNYIINTHAHSDHSGGIPSIIENHDIGRVYMKPVDWSKTVETNRMEYDNIYLATKYKSNSDDSYPKLVIPNREGYHVNVGEDAYFEIYNCTKVHANQYNNQDYNHFSFIVKFAYKNSSVVIGGDATNLADELIMNRIGHADVYSLEHHGDSLPYNSQSILDELTPTYVVSNSPRWEKEKDGIDRPAKDTVRRILKSGTLEENILVAGEEGDMVFVSDGDSFTYKNRA